MPAIRVRDLRKSYGTIEAVWGVDFDVAEGEIFDFLGRNGAGRTTIVEILEGHRQRSAGEVEVLGPDPAKGERWLRERIGIVLQETGVERFLRVAEVLELYCGYYPRPRAVDELLALVNLEEKRNEMVKKLSGGQRRRLDLALGLAGDPELVFLDEPTTGFESTARREAWEIVSNLRALGKTVFLTTHSMDEAQHLADRVAVIAEGRIVAEGPPDRLSGRDDATEIRFTPPSAAELPDLGPATLNSGARLEERGNIFFVTFFVPGILAFGPISACYTNRAIRMTINRDFGIPKRVRGTPVPTWAYLAGQVGSSVLITFILFVLTVGLGVVAFGVDFRTSTAAGLFVTLAAGAACFCALGLAVSGLSPNADAAPAIVNFSIFPLLFVSGIFFPLDNAPGWLTSVAKLFPMQQLADGLQYAFDPRTTGLGFNGGDLWRLLAWTVAGSLLAVRLFRWDSVKK